MKLRWWMLLVLSMLFTSCRTPALPPVVPLDSARPAEVPPVFIPLSGPLSVSRAEVSGLAWYGDELVLLPQYPGRLGDALYTLSRTELEAFLEGELTGSLEPRPWSFRAEGVGEIRGFEGFEALAFRGDTIYLTIEARVPGGMMGYLVRGRVTPEEIVVDVRERVELPPQAPLDNFSDESLLVAGEQLLTFYETQGLNVNPSPVARRFDAETLTPQGDLPFPTLEYRLTDVTALDEAGRFWGINYLWPGDVRKLQPGLDMEVEHHGQGATHAEGVTVERLVEFALHHDQIVRTETPPIQLVLGEAARNWEGVVRFGERGFLLTTDQHPETLLAFVAYPEP